MRIRHRGTGRWFHPELENRKARRAMRAALVEIARTHNLPFLRLRAMTISKAQVDQLLDEAEKILPAGVIGDGSIGDALERLFQLLIEYGPQLIELFGKLFG